MRCEAPPHTHERAKAEQEYDSFGVSLRGGVVDDVECWRWRWRWRWRRRRRRRRQRCSSILCILGIRYFDFTMIHIRVE